MRHVFQLKVPPAVEQGCDPAQEPKPTASLDDHDVEKPIVELRARRDRHPATEPPAVCDCDHFSGSAKHRGPVDAQLHRLRMPRRETAEGGQEESDAPGPPFCPSGTAIDVVRDDTREPRARNVEKIKLTLASRSAQDQATGVNVAGRKLCHRIDRAVDLTGKTEASRQIATRAQRKNRQFGAPGEARSQQASGYFAGGTVTTGYHHELDSRAHAFPGQRTGLSGFIRRAYLKGAQSATQMRLEGGPASPPPAAPGRRIHNHEGRLVHGATRSRAGCLSLGVDVARPRRSRRCVRPHRATLRAVSPTSLRIPGLDGVGLHVLEWSREGVPLLLVHGFGNEAHIWDDIAPALAPYYRTLAVDLRGHGDSDRDPEGRYSDDHMAGDLEALATTLEIERWVLIGHSLGGRVITRFAGRHPERVAGFVIIDSGPEHDRRGSLRIQLETERPGKVPGYTSREAYRAEVARNYPAAPARVVDRIATHGARKLANGGFEQKLDPAFMAGRQKATRGSDRETATELWKLLGRIDCPSLVLRGAASDVLSPDVADRMVEVLPRAELRIIARASHSVMADNPEDCRDAITAFALADA